LVLGGVYVARRQQSAARARPRPGAGSFTPLERQEEEEEEEEEDYGPAEILATQRSAPPARPASMLLEGLKEELFQLEVERRQGQISQTEYEKAKSALDQTLERALKREAQKT
jgi:hypothetical protein